MMSNEIVASNRTDLMQWASAESDTSKLLDQLRTCLALSIESIRNAAFIVRRLEELGFERSKLESSIPSTILRTLRRIAYGQMIPDTFLKLNGLVQERVGRLPISDQKRLCDGETVKVMLPGGDNLMVSAANLQPEQCRQVFGSGYIRDEAEQISYLAERGKLVSTTPKDPHEPASIDRRRRVLVVSGPTEFTERQLIAFIAELAK